MRRLSLVASRVQGLEIEACGGGYMLDKARDEHRTLRRDTLDVFGHH